MRKRCEVVLVPLVAILTACNGPAAVPAQSEATRMPSATQLPASVGAEMIAWLDLPVDPGLDPVSVSQPSAEASTVLDACWITDTKHALVKAIGFEPVAGMAKVAHARDLPTYLPLIIDVHIDTDDPAWAIRLQGELLLPHVEVRDPTCVVIGESLYWFPTGASKIDGEWQEGLRPPVGPQFRLPPLLP